MRKLPVLPTLLVAAAAATMVALGFWQLGRLEEKEALIARYERSTRMSADVRWPQTAPDIENALYRHARLDCRDAQMLEPIAGRSATGAAGWLYRAICLRAGGGEAEVALGVARDPAMSIAWPGGEVAGFIAPAGENVRLIASDPPDGLAPAAQHDPNDLPNNHLAYAGQWFFFALTAVAIYILALRRRWRSEP